MAENPVSLGESPEGPPGVIRGGNTFWDAEAEKIKAKEGKWLVYENVNSSIASYLRKEYGFEATGRTVTDEKTGETKRKVWVKYDRNKVDKIKAETKQRGESMKASRAKTKAKEDKAQPPAPR